MGKYLFWIVFVAFLIMVLTILVLKGDEDNWVKDSKGIWIKHGKPSNTPKEVLEQYEATNCSLGLYVYSKVVYGYENLSSQCLGRCGDYAVDIIHNPRAEEDNLPENQCSEFREGKLNYLIELDREGNIVRIF